MATIVFGSRFNRYSTQQQARQQALQHWRTAVMLRLFCQAYHLFLQMATILFGSLLHKTNWEFTKLTTTQVTWVVGVNSLLVLTLATIVFGSLFNRYRRITKVFQLLKDPQTR